MSNAITMSEKKVAKLKAEYCELMRETDAVYRETCWYKEELQLKAQALALASAQLWALKKAQENAIPQSGYRLAYVAG